MRVDVCRLPSDTLGRMTRLWLLATFLLMLATHGSAASASPTAQEPDPNLQTVRAILDEPDDQIDLTETKLIIDHMIDPSIDVAASLQQLDSMVKEVKANLPMIASSSAKVDALRKYLYVAGPWNANQPFRYDFDDPFGHDVRNKLLPTYLVSRKGNCVSMPFLFLLMGQRLGLDVTMSRAPAHLFIKYRNDSGQVINLEATSGAYPKQDYSYRRDSPMTDEALANGIYLQPLSKKQTVGEMVSVLLEFYDHARLHQRRIDMAQLILAHDSKDVLAMLHARAGYIGLEQQLVNAYLTPADFPPPLRLRVQQLERNIRFWKSEAFAAGWRPTDEATDVKYLQTIKRAQLVQ